jgi:hypothetical protein
MTRKRERRQPRQAVVSSPWVLSIEREELPT